MTTGHKKQQELWGSRGMFGRRKLVKKLLHYIANIRILQQIYKKSTLNQTCIVKNREIITNILHRFQ